MLKLLNDEIDKEKIRSGKRIRRGLYKRKDGKVINADINAALNIIKNINVPQMIQLSI